MMLPDETWRRVVYGVLAVFAALGLWALSDVIEWWALAVIPAAGVLLLLAKLSEFCKALAVVVGAIAVPWLSLLGFNQVWHWVFNRHVRPSLELGLILAGVVFAAGAASYLLAWREKKWATPFVALGLAVVNVVGVPLLIAAPQGESTVAAPQVIVSKLDLAIVVPGISAKALRQFETSRPQPDWDVRYSVARASPKGIDWLLLDSADTQAARAAARGSGTPIPGTPAGRDHADQLVLLDVDGTPPVTLNPATVPSIAGTKGEVTRWLRIARQAAPRASMAVLLQTTDPHRIAAWERKVEPQGGSVASVQQMGTRTLTDAALVLAAQAPSASEELSLALRFRPVLLFDDGETLGTPLDIDAFLRSERVDLCHDDRLLAGSRCNPVLRSSDLVNGSTHLRIRRVPSPDPVSSMYVHPTTVNRGGRKLLFLDYWWYLDGNPAAIGKGTSCGAGLALPGKTCFDHDSDWEGMTLVLDRTSGSATPVAVQYAQHSDVVRYDFAQLRDYWMERRRNDRGWNTSQFRQNLARIDDVDSRPLAFVARGTHATYRDRCPSGCHQVAKKLKEKPHTGLDSWPANDTAHCVATHCLRLLPTRRGGREPALWNAYEGVWGDRRCILHGTFCTAEVSPGAPATQGRYKNPARISGYVDARWKFQACGKKRGPCPPQPEPALELR